MKTVVLYYPNASWRANIGELASSEDKSFNWFLCSKRYRDPLSNLYIAEISKSTKFYDENTGSTLVPSPENESPPKLLIEDDPENSAMLNSSKDVTNAIKKYKYQGSAKIKKCGSSSSTSSDPSSGSGQCDEDFLCREAVFTFLPGILISSTKEKVCPIIDYAKRNHKTIRRYISDFPSPLDIDQAVEEFQCSTVCRVLYQDISEYFRLRS